MFLDQVTMPICFIIQMLRPYGKPYFLTIISIGWIEVERHIEELGENGGYILGAVHNIQPDVPLDNVLVMYQYGKDYIPS